MKNVFIIFAFFVFSTHAKNRDSCPFSLAAMASKMEPADVRRARSHNAKLLALSRRHNREVALPVFPTTERMAKIVVNRAFKVANRRVNRLCRITHKKVNFENTIAELADILDELDSVLYPLKLLKDQNDNSEFKEAIKLIYDRALDRRQELLENERLYNRVVAYQKKARRLRDPERIKINRVMLNTMKETSFGVPSANRKAYMAKKAKVFMLSKQAKENVDKISEVEIRVPISCVNNIPKGQEKAFETKESDYVFSAALMDLLLHMQPSGKIEGGIQAFTNAIITKYFLPPDDEAHFISRFYHPFKADSAYDAQYFVYLQGDLFAADVALEFLNSDRGFLDSELGERFKDFILQPGAHTDALNNIEAFLGRKFRPSALASYLERVTQ